MVAGSQLPLSADYLICRKSRRTMRLPRAMAGLAGNYAPLRPGTATLKGSVYCGFKIFVENNFCVCRLSFVLRGINKHLEPTMASYFNTMAMRSAVLTSLFVLTASAASAAEISCSNYRPENINRSISASDPNFIRIITGAVAEKCAAELAAAKQYIKSPLRLKSGARPSNGEVLEFLRQQSEEAERNPYQRLLGTYANSDDLRTYSDSSYGALRPKAPLVASVILDALNVSSRTTIADAAGKFAQRSGIDKIGDQILGAMKTEIASVSINPEIGSAGAFERPSDVLFELLGEHTSEDVLAILKSSNFSGEDELESLIKAKIDNFSEISQIQISMFGVSVPVRKIVESAEKGSLSPLLDELQEEQVARNTISEIERVVRFLVEDCIKSPEAACPDIFLNKPAASAEAVKARLLAWVASQQEALTSSVGASIERKRKEIERAIAAAANSASSAGVALRFLQNPSSNDAPRVFSEILIGVVDRTGIDDRSLRLLRLVACSANSPPSQLRCEPQGLTRAVLLAEVRKFVDPAAPEYTALVSILEGKTPNLQTIELDLQKLNQALQAEFDKTLDALLTSLEVPRTSPDKIVRAMGTLAMAGTIAAGSNAVEQLVLEQAKQLEAIESVTGLVDKRLDDLKGEVGKLPDLISAAAGPLSEELQKANRQIREIRNSFAVGISELEIVQKRTFGAGNSFDERLEGLRVLSQSRVLELLPANDAAQLKQNIATINNANSAWRALSSAYAEPSASNIGGAIAALQMLPMGDNERQVLSGASQVLSLYSTATTLFAASNPVGLAVTGLSMFSSGGGFLGGGGGGLFGGGGPDPAVMAALAAIRQQLAIIDKKIDRVLELQQKTLEKLDAIAAQIDRNQADIMEVLFEIRDLQEQTIRRLNFVDYAWARSCSAVDAALKTGSATAPGTPAFWQVLRANVDNVVSCVGGLQTFVQNAEDNETYNARRIAPIRQTAIDQCRAAGPNVEESCDRLRDWSVSAYEASWRLLTTLRRAEPTKISLDRLVWQLLNPSVDFAALDSRHNREVPAAESGQLPEPFTSEICGAPTTDFPGLDGRDALATGPGIQTLMAQPLAADFILADVGYATRFYSLMNLRPFLRTNGLDITATDVEPHKAGVWALLCKGRVALQLAIAQQSLLSGDALLPHLLDEVVRPAEEKETSAAQTAKTNRAALFDAMRSNQMLGRNLALYTITHELERFSGKFVSSQDNQQRTSCHIDGIENETCIRMRPRNTRAFELAREFPTRFGANYTHSCGDSLVGPLASDNQECIMSLLLPRLRMNLKKDEKKNNPPTPALRYVSRPFLVREEIGTSRHCRLEPGQAWYFVWARDLDDQTLFQTRGTSLEQGQKAEDAERATCSDFKFGKSLKDKWPMDIVDANKLFVIPVPSSLEMASAIFKHPPELTKLLAMESQVIDVQQTLRILTPGASDARAVQARRLFLLSSLATSR